MSPLPPDSDSYLHILMNGALWYVVLFGVPTVRWVARRRREWRRFVSWHRQQATQRNLQVHRGLHPNVTVVLPDQRSAR